MTDKTLDELKRERLHAWKMYQSEESKEEDYDFIKAQEWNEKFNELNQLVKEREDV